MKVIKSTVYAADHAKKGAAGDDHIFLSKGGSSDEMFQRIREVLDKGGPSDGEIS